MSAPNPVPSSTTGDARPHEPSMEEILASIRRIIADDQSLPGRTHVISEGPAAEEPAASGHAPVASDQAPVASDHAPGETALAATQASAEDPAQHADAEPEAHETDETMMAQGTIAAPQYPTPDGPVGEHLTPHAAPPHGFAVESQPGAHRRDPDVVLARQPDDVTGDYFDPPHEYDRPVAAASEPAPLFSAATNSSVSSAFNVLAASRIADNSEELLGLAREMIRPLLRTWLDENLPSMVERLVREEIERVARGGR